MIFTETELLPISALQHLIFCERQWGLIHLEQVWTENLLTAEGRILHEKAHDLGMERRPGLHVTRSLRIRSLRLGLSGVADVVEFHPIQNDKTTRGIALAGRKGLWQPFPVEYKRGRPKPDDCDRIQLCAQAMCLEEMLAVDIPDGAIFYGKPRRRENVEIDMVLREKTMNTARRLHELTRAGKTPPPKIGVWCKSCSLQSICRPKAVGTGASVADYRDRYLFGPEEWTGHQ